MKIKRRPFGKTGLNVTEVSFGSMNMRLLNNLEECRALTNYALDCGINLIDTARGYYGTLADGTEMEGEAVVGEVLASRSDITEPIIVVTKGHGYTPETYDEDLQLSVDTLGIKSKDGKHYIGKTEIIFVNFFHGIKADRWETMTTSGVLPHAKKLCEEGRCNYIGFSSHQNDGAVIREAIKSGFFQACELPYNVYSRNMREFEGDDLIKLAHENGMAVINMKAFGGTSMSHLKKHINPITGITSEQLLRFCLSCPYVSTVDAGARLSEELDADIKTASAPGMDKKEADGLVAKSKSVSPVLNTICRGCMHCTEKFTCPQGVDFPNLLILYAQYTVATALKNNAYEYTAKYKSLPEKADKCIKCGECNKWCEYTLDIPAMLSACHEEMGR